MNIETLDTLGYVAGAYPKHLRGVVQHAMEAWQSFCGLSFEEKEKISGGDRLRDFGYMLRQDEGPRADRKELAHVKLSNFNELLTRASELRDMRPTGFIRATELLLDAITPFIGEFAEAIEGRYEMRGFAKEVRDSRANWTFRYLHYFPTDSVGNEIAHPHVDRGGFTLHLDESHTGAEYLGLTDKKWHPLPVSLNETMIFPSMGLQYRSDSRLKALCHRVRATPHAAKGGRFSMVAFIDFKMGHRYNDAVQRTQDFPPGFNYKMPDGEFKSLFIPAESQTV